MSAGKLFAISDLHVAFPGNRELIDKLYPESGSGVPFEEVSVGYPTEWQRRASPPAQSRQILPAPYLRRAP